MLISKHMEETAGIFWSYSKAQYYPERHTRRKNSRQQSKRSTALQVDGQHSTSNKALSGAAQASSAGQSGMEIQNRQPPDRGRHLGKARQG